MEAEFVDGKTMANAVQGIQFMAWHLGRGMGMRRRRIVLPPNVSLPIEPLPLDIQALRAGIIQPEARPQGNYRSTQGVPDCEHKDRPIYARGICQSCYRADYRRSLR